MHKSLLFISILVEQKIIGYPQKFLLYTGFQDQGTTYRAHLNIETNDPTLYSDLRGPVIALPQFLYFGSKHFSLFPQSWYSQHLTSLGLTDGCRPKSLSHFSLFFWIPVLVLRHTHCYDKICLNPSESAQFVQ